MNDFQICVAFSWNNIIAIIILIIVVSITEFLRPIRENDGPPPEDN